MHTYAVVVYIYYTLGECLVCKKSLSLLFLGKVTQISLDSYGLLARIQGNGLQQWQIEPECFEVKSAEVLRLKIVHGIDKLLEMFNGVITQNKTQLFLWVGGFSCLASVFFCVSLDETSFAVSFFS